AEGRVERAKKNHLLRQTLLDVSVPQETGSVSRGKVSRLPALGLPSVDRQYAEAFHLWGLDVDGSAEDEVVERMSAEPNVVVQEMIAALDSWMMERRGRRGAEWHRLFRIADRLDSSERRRRLRALLAGELPPRAEWVAGLIAVRSPWTAVWELARGN